MSGLTVNIETIIKVMARVYTEGHELRVHGCGICGIDDMAGNCEIDFNNLDELYEWTLKNQEEL